MPRDGVYRARLARVHADRVVRMARAQVRVERLIRHLADVLAGDDAQVRKFNAVGAHDARLKQRRADGGAPVLVHAAVKDDVHAHPARAVDHGKGLVLHAHAVLVDEVRDDHPAAGMRRQIDGLLQGVKVRHGVHVRIDGDGLAVRPGDAAQRLHLQDGRAGRVRRSERHAARAAGERPLAQLGHPVDLIFVGRLKGVQCTRGLAQRAHADHLRLMNRERFLRVQKFGEIHRRKAAVAAHAGGDALQEGQFARVDMAVDVAVRIDEARADKQAPRVDHLRVLRRSQVADGGDAPALEQHLRAKASSRLRVDHHAPGNEQLRHDLTSHCMIRQRKPACACGLSLTGALRPPAGRYRLSLKVVQMSWNFCSSALERFLTYSASPMRS